MKIALLGAESTGKTQLSRALAAHFQSLGRATELVPEVLREWCEREGRVPRREEQIDIAREQARRVDAAQAQAEVVIADTTALMVAAYSEWIFKDFSLYAMALAHQRSFDVTLVTGIDLPWVADGLQREGPHVQGPVDALVRAALSRGNIPYHVVYGDGEERLRNALAVVPGGVPRGALEDGDEAERGAGGIKLARWTWVCDKCSDPQCEHRLFRDLARDAG